MSASCIQELDFLDARICDIPAPGRKFDVLRSKVEECCVSKGCQTCVDCEESFCDLLLQFPVLPTRETSLHAIVESAGNLLSPA